MSHTLEAAATRLTATEAEVNRVVVGGNTKDAGRVKVGGSGIRFTKAPVSTKDAGRVKVGGSGIRYADSRANTKDAGRARFGGSGIRF